MQVPGKGPLPVRVPSQKPLSVSSPSSRSSPCRCRYWQGSKAAASCSCLRGSFSRTPFLDSIAAQVPPIVFEIAALVFVAQMASFVQHGNVSTLDHVMRVAERALRWSRKLPCRICEDELVRGAVLHDYSMPLYAGFASAASSQAPGNAGLCRNRLAVLPIHRVARYDPLLAVLASVHPWDDLAVGHRLSKRRLA